MLFVYISFLVTLCKASWYSLREVFDTADSLSTMRIVLVIYRDRLSVSVVSGGDYVRFAKI